MIAILCSTAVFAWNAFCVLTAALTLYIAGWTTNMAIFSAVGAWRMRRDSGKDWHAKYLKLKEEDSATTDVVHFVILPNYKEEESMLKETLENLGRAPMAQSRVRVILGMEQREGPGVEQKAARLIAETSHLFAGISATFHPAGLRGEVPGKSSNTQWAYHKVLQEYDSQLKASFDPSRVFLTVMDADTILHPQYFSNLSYQAMTMSRESRVWRMWQSPVLLLRNFFSVPGVTRVSGLGTVLFELAGLANQHIGSHITFSSYSLTLSLASHKAVGGWDPDVIGEDHHMFAKCYFAPLWDAAQPSPQLPPAPIETKLQLDPIYLPALCYMAESPEQETWSSIKVRFTQARRHSQGIAELSYCFLQYIRLCMTVGFFALPIATHRGALCVIWKMFTVHVTNTVQATSLCLGALVMVQKLTMWALNGGISTFLLGGADFFTSAGITETARYAMISIIGNVGPVTLLSALTTFLVIRANLNGHYDAGQARLIQNNPAKSELSMRQSLSLLARFEWDFLTLGEPTVMLFGMVPELMATWSLIWRGTAFEYLVAPKPLTRKQDTQE
jgi:hypothetical protein